MEKESENPILETTVAILIAVVVVIGALVSWRASVIDDGAGDADYAGLRATVHSVRAMALNISMRMNLMEIMSLISATLIWSIIGRRYYDGPGRSTGSPDGTDESSL